MHLFIVLNRLLFLITHLNAQWNGTTGHYWGHWGGAVGHYSVNNNLMFQLSEALTILFSLLPCSKRGKVQGGIGFAFASHWSKNWRKIFNRTTKRSNRNRVICFDVRLKLLSLVSCSGARFSKVPKTFRARKAIRKTPTCLFYKADPFICCKGKKE